MQTFLILNNMSETQDCPSCYRKIKSNSRFCKYCGTTLKPCPKCSTLNKGDGSFCAECGADISSVEVAESYSKREPLTAEEEKTQAKEFLEEGGLNRRQQLIVWPPSRDDIRYYTQAQSRARRPYSYTDYLDKEPTYEPKKVNYAYSRVRILGFLGGPLPTSSVLSSVVEAFGIALALIALGIVIFSIGMAFFQYLIFPIISGVLGGAFLLSAPFFGIYYVSSNWLYRTFEIKRPVKLMTIIWNYTLASFIFAILALMIAPIFIQGGALAITFTVVGGIVYLMGLIIVPLKAYLADLVYVKAALNAKEKESEDENEIEKKKNVEK